MVLHQLTDEGYKPTPVERYTVLGLAIMTVVTVIGLVIHNEPIADINLVIILRIVISLGCAAIAAILPGYLQLNWKMRGGLTIRAGGALAVFLITFLFYGPKAVQYPPGSGDEKALEYQKALKMLDDLYSNSLGTQQGVRGKNRNQMLTGLQEIRNLKLDKDDQAITDQLLALVNSAPGLKENFYDMVETDEISKELTVLKLHLESKATPISK